MKTAKRDQDKILVGVNVAIRECTSKKGNPFTVVQFEDEYGKTLFSTFDREIVRSFMLEYYLNGGEK